MSILRAGEALEEALVSVCKDVKIGKILIQTNKNTTEPEVHIALLNLCNFIMLLVLIRAQKLNNVFLKDSLDAAWSLRH